MYIRYRAKNIRISAFFAERGSRMRNREVWRVRKRSAISHTVEIRQLETLPGLLRNPRTVVMATVLLVWLPVHRRTRLQLDAAPAWTQRRCRKCDTGAVSRPAQHRVCDFPHPSFYVVIYEVTGPLGS